jgi:phage RecT family recombinase
MAFLKQVLSTQKLNEGEFLGISRERMLGFALTACTRQPDLLKCTPVSILQSLQESVRVGLDPSGTLGQAYLIPYGKKATLIIGYQGFIQLIYRSGVVKKIYAEAVFEGEHFEVFGGTEQRIIHNIDIDGDRNDEKKLRGCYAVAVLMTGETLYVWMNKKQLDVIRNRSQSSKSSSSPWHTDPIEMYKKTPIRRIRKYLPMDSKQQELVMAAEVIDNADYEVVGSESGNGQKRRATPENLEALGALGKEVQPEPTATATATCPTCHGNPVDAAGNHCPDCA